MIIEEDSHSFSSAESNKFVTTTTIERKDFSDSEDCQRKKRIKMSCLGCGGNRNDVKTNPPERVKESGKEVQGSQIVATSVNESFNQGSITDTVNDGPTTTTTSRTRADSKPNGNQIPQPSNSLFVSSATTTTTDQESRNTAGNERVENHKPIDQSSEIKGDQAPSKKFEDDYDVGKVLGEGGFAVVKLATNKRTGQKVAVKEAKKENFKTEHNAELIREFELLKSLDHPNIVRAIHMYEEEKHYFFVLEYMEGGELFDRIVEKKRYSEKEARDAFQSIVYGIEYFHSKDIVHRDLKPENLLLSR